MDVSSASLAVGQATLQFSLQEKQQAVEQVMQQELALIEAMAGAAPIMAAPPPGVGTVVDLTA